MFTHINKMNYKRKYIKYKKKYLELKIQLGGAAPNIAGPISFYYLKTVESKKQILLLGDIHTSLDSIPSNYTDVVTFIKQLATKPPQNQCLDICFVLLYDV